MIRLFHASGRYIDIPQDSCEHTSTSLVDVINCLADELEALYKMLETPKEQANIVRCKDCRYYDPKYCADGFGWCDRRGIGHGSSDNWFCADGSIKENINENIKT